MMSSFKCGHSLSFSSSKDCKAITPDGVLVRTVHAIAACLALAMALANSGGMFIFV